MKEILLTREAATLAVLCLLFALGMFFRLSPAVIAPNLIAEFSLDPAAIGLLGGGFFFAFAVMQLPIGPLLDRVGPHIIITAFALVAACGALLFSIAPTYPFALAARILMGIGMAAMLMGAFKVFTLAFPAAHFSTLAGVVLAVGMGGSMLASSPLAYLTASVGWRTVFFATGTITAVLAIANYFLLAGTLRKNTLPPDPDVDPGGMSLFQSARLILSSVSFWQISTLSFFRNGTFASLQGLWLGLYLMEIKRLSAIDAGNILLMLPVGSIAGSLVAGRLNDRTSFGAKTLNLWGMGFYGLCLLPFCGFGRIEPSGMWMGLTFVMGFFHAFGTLLYTHAKQLFPLKIAGTVMTSVNFFFMLGGAVMMIVIGNLMELLSHTGTPFFANAYEFCFFVGFLTMVASLIFYAASKSGEPLPPAMDGRSVSGAPQEHKPA